MSSSIVLSAAVVLSATLTYQALLLVFRRSPLGDIRGPPSASFIFGNFRQVQADDDEQLTERWLEEYGHVVVHKGLFGVRRALSPRSIRSAERPRSQTRSSPTTFVRYNTC
jgi:hypothetical protein